MLPLLKLSLLPIFRCQWGLIDFNLHLIDLVLAVKVLSLWAFTIFRVHILILVFPAKIATLFTERLKKNLFFVVVSTVEYLKVRVKIYLLFLIVIILLRLIVYLVDVSSLVDIGGLGKTTKCGKIWLSLHQWLRSGPRTGIEGRTLMMAWLDISSGVVKRDLLTRKIITLERRNIHLLSPRLGKLQI